jgi:hypothetical protein
MRIKLYLQPTEKLADHVAALELGYEVAFVGEPRRTGNAGQPGEVAVSVRAALRRRAES